MRVSEEYKKTGYFWLPEKKGNKIPGVLSITHDGKIELEIIELFDDSIKNFNENNINRIIGFIENDGLVTLDDCFYTKKSLPTSSLSKSRILVNKAFIGVALETDEPIVFNSFSFSIDCLDEWVGISGIKVDHNWENKTAKISYEHPKEIQVTLDNGMTLEICFAYSIPGFPTQKEAKITQRIYLRLASTEPIDLNEFIIISFKMTNFICFAIGEIVTIKDVSATSSKILKKIDNNDTYPLPIKIYYQSIPYSEKEPKVDWNDMLFTYGIIENNFQYVINKWIDSYDLLSPAFSLYFSTKAGAQKYLDGKFLALAQGLETYHRRISNEKLMDQQDFEILKSIVLKSCPSEHIDWLNGRLMHGNEISLNKRLTRIIEPFKKHLGTNKERSKLLRNIVNTRNYLTHYSKSLEKQSAKREELYYLCLKMEAIFNLHFLNVIGFTTDEIDKIIETCHSLNFKLKK